MNNTYAMFIGYEIRPEREWQGRTFPETYILRFLDTNFNVLQFTVDERPAYCEKNPNWLQLPVGTLEYSIEPDQYASRTGKDAYKSVYSSFTGIKNVKIEYSGIVEKQKTEAQK